MSRKLRIKKFQKQLNDECFNKEIEFIKQNPSFGQILAYSNNLTLDLIKNEYSY